jgi:hypothetical protein
MPAQSPTDVINAWNAHCAVCNFDECPNPAPSISLSGSYNGTNLAVDKPKLMKLIQQEVQSFRPGDPGDDEWLSAVIDDPAWYK